MTPELHLLAGTGVSEFVPQVLKKKTMPPTDVRRKPCEVYPPGKINMSPEKGPFFKGNVIFQPSVLW